MVNTKNTTCPVLPFLYISFRDEKRFFKNVLGKIDKNNTALVYLYTANRWLAIRLVSFCSLFSSSFSFFKLDENLASFRLKYLSKKKK